MLAQNDTPVTTAFPHPRWCTGEHHNAGPGTHQSVEMPLGTIAGTPVTVQRVQDDPEPGRPETRHELWLSIGGLFIDIPVDDAHLVPQQIRNVAASLELILGGA